MPPQHLRSDPAPLPLLLPSSLRGQAPLTRQALAVKELVETGLILASFLLLQNRMGVAICRCAVCGIFQVASI